MVTGDVMTGEEFLVVHASEQESAYRVGGQMDRAFYKIAFRDEFDHLVAPDEVVGFFENLFFASAGAAKEQEWEKCEYDDPFHGGVIRVVERG